MLEVNGKGRKADWKENLSVEAEQELNQLLERVKKHRCAYKDAENVQISQLWCTLIEMFRINNELEQRVARIEKVLGGLFKTYEEDKDQLVKSLIKF